MNIKFITNQEIVNKLKANNIQINEDKKEFLLLYNSNPLNRKKEKYSNFKNMKISDIVINSEKNEYINENFKSKLNPSRNHLFRLTDRNNSDLSHTSSKSNKDRIFSFKTINTSTKPKLFLRKFELELNKLINKKYNKKLINLKTFGNKFNNKQKENNYNNIKSLDINRNKILSKSEKFLSKDNKKIIKKNYSGKNFDKILRKIIYFNQKNDLIAKKDIINLIQQEENSLNIRCERERNKIPKSKMNSLSEKKQILINPLFLPNPINKAKSEINLFQKTDNLYNKKLRLKNINKKINLKTNYNEEYDLYDNENNIDNYVKSKKYSSIINYFKSLYENEKNKLGNKKELDEFNNINSFTDINNFPSNETSEDQDNKNEIFKKRKSDVSNKKFSFSKFNNSSKKRKSIVEGYLLNYNINSEKYLNSILKERNKAQLNFMNQNKDSSKEFISEFEDILIEKKKVRSSYHNYLFDPFENNVNFNFKNNNIGFDSNFPNHFSKKNLEIQENNKQKLNEKDLSKMKIIYEVNEQEKNNNNEYRNNYFSINNKNIKNKNKKIEKNKDIVKYINDSKYGKPPEKEVKKNSQGNNKYSYFYFNNQNNLNKQILTEINKYNFSRNNNSPLNHANTQNIKEKNDLNEVNKEEEKDKKENKKKDNLKLDSGQDNNKIRKRSIELNTDISIKELSVLDSNKIDVKEKFRLIKEYKDKAIFLIFTIVTQYLKKNQELQMNIENLIKFMLIDNYKKYVNILKILIDKERSMSLIAKSEKVKDTEIFKYIHRIFSDRYSPYYIKPKKDNQTTNKSNDEQTNNLHLLNLLIENNENVLSHKKSQSIIKTEEKIPKKETLRKKKEYEIEKQKPKLKLKKKSVGKRMTIKEFLQDKYDDEEKHKKDYLKQKLSLTNELKYQIQITNEEEGKRRFKNLLNQIETLKHNDIADYINFIHEKYGIYKNEINKLVNVREKEQRINYFINDLIDERDILKKLKKIKERNFSFENCKI